VVLDEVGQAIGPSGAGGGEANCAGGPFVYASAARQTSSTLHVFWPTRAISEGEAIVCAWQHQVRLV
jgi:hypothetical protein